MISFGLAIEAHRRTLYGYAMRLCHNRDDAEDLVQETMFLGLRAEHQFQAGTNLAAWLTTIMRNKRFTPRKNLIVEDVDGKRAAVMASNDDTSAAYEARDALTHLAELPSTHSRAMVMLGEGMSVHEVAALEGVPDGTIKSRAHRGRAMLAELIGGTP
jgi:RNA polymerase sigma-70 factor (ECF subfamily)